ncbi:zinc finger protein [Plasmodium brasilianum]|uniref:Zinc finger protein n=1 Tax=Plasmodium brasilianum TaxID=5824 RepID=A0ACB9Y5W8_PLABR|nr:zinc finger protein [Plasmodium brasilianum]
MSVTLRQHFWKTKLCPLHMENRCKEGDNCDYAHSIEDLRSIPDLKRTKLCYKLLKGEKCFNKKCNYAHNQDELKSAQNLFAYKSSMCKFVANKTCLNGSTCRFAHTIDELRVPRIPEILLEKSNTELVGENDLTTFLDNGNINETNNNRMSMNNDNDNNNIIENSSNNNCKKGSIMNTNSNDSNNNERYNRDNFNKNFDMMLNSFKVMSIANIEHGYNNTNCMKVYNHNNINHMNGNNGLHNNRGERKKKKKIETEIKKNN